MLFTIKVHVAGDKSQQTTRRLLRPLKPAEPVFETPMSSWKSGPQCHEHCCSTRLGVYRPASSWSWYSDHNALTSLVFHCRTETDAEHIQQLSRFSWTARNHFINWSRTRCVWSNRTCPDKRFRNGVCLPVVLYGCETWSLTLREEHRLMVYENRVLRRIFGP
jgi:hypothetical protein